MIPIASQTGIAGRVEIVARRVLAITDHRERGFKNFVEVLSDSFQITCSSRDAVINY